MQKRKKKSSAPLYAFAGAWLLLSLMFRMYRLGGFIAVLLISLIVGCIAGKISAKNQPVEVPEPESELSYGPEIDPIVADGKKAREELQRLYQAIPNNGIRQRITQIASITEKIVENAINDPKDIPQIKRFFSYYLPTTIKLLNTYDRMGQQGVSGENIDTTMKSIEQMLDTAIAAYHKQLDSLFADQALDIETDISVMNTMLRREGLSDDPVKPSDFLTQDPTKTQN